MTLPQRAFFTVQEVTIRWDCSPYDLAGWAIAGKLDVVTAIEPIEQDGEVLAGLVVVPVADILSMFRRWESRHAPLQFTRDEIGQERRRASPLGFSLGSDWDAVGQLTRQQGPGIQRDYDWTRAYEPLTITDTRWGEKRYDYDRNGQITRTRHGDGSAERFAYTPDLNIAATGGETDRFLNWQTTAAGVVRIAHGPRGEVVTLEHDACGRVVRRTVMRKGFRPQTWTFEWNAQDQLVVADGPNGRWRYGYDPLGRRIWKESLGHLSPTSLV